MRYLDGFRCNLCVFWICEVLSCFLFIFRSGFEVCSDLYRNSAQLPSVLSQNSDQLHPACETCIGSISEIVNKCQIIQNALEIYSFMLKLCEVGVPTSFTTSENFMKKYWFLVKLSTIFDRTTEIGSFRTKSMKFPIKNNSRNAHYRFCSKFL